MIDPGFTKAVTRRDLFRNGAILAGGVLLAPGLPAWMAHAAESPRRQETPKEDALPALRAEWGANPIEQVKLTESLTMLSGPGGNVVVMEGADGKIVVDSFVQPAWGALEQVLAGIGPAPLRILINTHWHFDHADNNASFRRVGAAVLAHRNTRTRLSTPQRNEPFDLDIPPTPSQGLPTQTFEESHTLYADGERLTLCYIQPAHTDTDIYIHYEHANLLHAGDLFFNGIYPFIDADSGGSIDGMIAGVDTVLELVDDGTRIVPGHGPPADKAALERYRDMLATIRDRVQELKAGGRTLEEVVAAKPTASFDEAWGDGFLQPDSFVAIVYNTL